MTDPTNLTIEELGPLLRQRKVSPVELTRAYLERIDRLDPVLHAYITVTAERALDDARRAEREIGSGEDRGPLHGIPIALKDNIDTAGVRTTAGSRILEHRVPERDARIARQLREAGTILLGKTNLHEFAYGATTENPHYGAARNPWDTDRVPGGSSGGSAVAIAAGMCAGSIGTDTGGSVRIPASLCGVVGLKTTFDPPSLEGIIPLSLSLDSVGPMARTVADAELLLRATSPFVDARNRGVGHEGRLAMPPPGANDAPLRGIVLGRPQHHFNLRIDPEVRRAVDAALESCVKLGARCVDVDMPWMAKSDEAGTRIAIAEAYRWHVEQGWFPARAAEYGEDVRKRLEMGPSIGEPELAAAQRVRAELTRETLRLFASIHAIAAPTAPTVASPIGAQTVNICGEEEPVRSAFLRLNRSANVTGLPAFSVPCGFSSSGLPIGLQLIGPPHGELDLCRIARAYEQAHDWHNRRPAPG